MNKNKNKKSFFQKKIFTKIGIFFGVIIVSGASVYGLDVIGDYIKTQTSIGTGTNNNEITFSNKKTTYYINKNGDNILVGDNLKGFYYDNIYGYFRLDWSETQSDNVNITSGPTTIGTCTEGYKFSGKAYSKYVGYIDFNYDNDKFVYYCKDDNKIYGKTYSLNLGFQILDGIEINISKNIVIENIEEDLDFANNSNIIIEKDKVDGSNNNWNDDNIGGGDAYEIENSDIENKDGNTFWIVK